MKNYITALVILVATLFGTASTASAATATTSSVLSGYVKVIGDSVQDLTSSMLLSTRTAIWVNQMTRGLRIHDISITVLYDGNIERRELRFTHEKAGFLIEVVLID